MVTAVRLGHLHPLIQCLSVLAASSVAMWLLRHAFDQAVWYIMATGMMLLGALNPMIGAFWEANFKRYVLISVLGVTAAGALLWLLARQLSGGAPTREITMLVAAAAIFYFMMTGLCILYRVVVAYARKL